MKHIHHSSILTILAAGLFAAEEAPSTSNPFSHDHSNYAIFAQNGDDDQAHLEFAISLKYQF
jgi:hypothetical protein